MFKPTFELNKNQITPAQFLTAELANGISLENHSFQMLAQSAINTLFKYEPKTILDYGAGVGAYTQAAIELGYNTYTFEIWEDHRNYMKERIKGLQLVDEPITTDALLLIEVAEHMTDSELKTLFKKIQPKVILFSSTSQTTDYDLEWGHINIKQQDKWIQFFANIGYKLDSNVSTPTSWSKIFIK